MFTYSHANTPLSQSERAYCLSYFINDNRVSPVSWDPSIVRPLLRDIVTQFARESFRICRFRGSCMNMREYNLI